LVFNVWRAVFLPDVLSYGVRPEPKLWAATDTSLGPQHRDLGLEVSGGLKGPVDAREAQVRDLVELSQRRQDRESDVVGGDLGAAAGTQRPLDLGAQVRERVLTDRPALACLADAEDHLLAAERLGGPERLTTVSCTISCVENRFSHAGQTRRRRIDEPSSLTRLSRTRVSVLRQCGQCMRCRSFLASGPLDPSQGMPHRAPDRALPGDQGVDELGTKVRSLWVINHNLWIITSV
jgi:hypothetical protein